MIARPLFVLGCVAACDAPHLPAEDGGAASTTTTASSNATATSNATSTATATATGPSSSSATSATTGAVAPPTVRVIGLPPGITLDRRATWISVETTAPAGGALVVSRDGAVLSTTDVTPHLDPDTIAVSVALVRGTNALTFAVEDPRGARAEASLELGVGRPVAATLDTLFAAGGDRLVAWGGGSPIAAVTTLPIAVTSIVAGQDAVTLLDAGGDLATFDGGAPAPIAGASGVLSVAVGGGHTLALREDGAVLAWGANGRGQLGDGGTTPNSAPAVVPGVDDVVAIAAAFETSFAVRRDGAVFVWGSNEKGLLGNGNEDAFAHPSPAIVPGLVDVAGVAAGRGHVIVVDRAGALRAWGNGASGQLGNGASGILAFATQPVLLSIPEPMVDVAAKGNVSFAIGASGALFAWGQNGSGQLGVGDTSVRTVPTATLLSGATAVAPGSTSAIARDAGSTFFAWGSNASAQLGQPSPPDGPGLSSAPVELAWP